MIALLAALGILLAGVLLGILLAGVLLGVMFADDIREMAERWQPAYGGHQKITPAASPAGEPRTMLIEDSDGTTVRREVTDVPAVPWAEADRPTEVMSSMLPSRGLTGPLPVVRDDAFAWMRNTYTGAHERREPRTALPPADVRALPAARTPTQPQVVYGEAPVLAVDEAQRLSEAMQP